MRTLLFFLITSVTLVGLLNACGPSEEEQQRQRMQARQDSLQRARQIQLQQQRLDSIARARAAEAEREEAEETEEQETQGESRQLQIQFNPNGSLAVQVEAWRSRDKAEQQISKWQERGFPNAYVVKHGSEATGNIWFRVRLGRVSDMDMARNISRRLQNEYDERVWIANAEPEDEAPADSVSQ